MLTVPDLYFGAIDAGNYANRAEKEFLSRVFYKDHFLEDVLKDRTYFLMGEKGTGKTAYATLLSNIDYYNTAAKRNTKSTIQYLDGTDYPKFIALREKNQIQISGYGDVWKVILLLLTAYHLRCSEPPDIMQFLRFRQLQTVIDVYYRNAFAPEIAYALEFVENSEQSVSLITKYLNTAIKSTDNVKETTQGFQINLLFICRQFEEAIRSLKLTNNHVIFIDGIDLRPDDITYNTYIDCLKGLAWAAWELNTHFFANIKDSKGRIKIVLLLRPDIFVHLGYHNPNAKVRDNAVMLDWRTDYDEFKTSRIFRLIDGIIWKQQVKDCDDGVAWKHYFPYDIPHMRIAERTDDPFIGFLRYSYHRPRDIISYLLFMQEHVKLHGRRKDEFSNESFEACQAAYSDYLLGEVRDHLRFYYADIDFDELTGFFRYLGGRSSFTWQMFRQRYRSYIDTVDKEKLP